MTEYLVRAERAKLAYGKHVVLDDVQLTVHRGEFWFFLGPNGQGKTTLLRAILGLVRPAGGTLHLGADRAHLGFVPQRCDLNPSLPTTVREFVLLGLTGLSVPKPERVERLAWALGQVGLSNLASKSYWALSGGQRQRALLARALVRKPSLLILDEPTNGLDLPSEEALLDALDRLHAGQDLTILLVTHDLALATRHATHVALFGGGRVVAGDRASTLTADRLEAAYGVRVSATARGELL